MLDVIEIRFLTAAEHRRTGLSESTFVVLCGCYLHFVPSPFAANFTHRIKGLITPDEVHCHIRGGVSRKMVRKTANVSTDSLWHLECSKKEQQKAFDDVLRGLDVQVLELFAHFDIQCVIEYLKQPGRKLGLGVPGSYSRNYLLGFCLLRLGCVTEAKSYFARAKEFVDERNEVHRNMFQSLKQDAPVFVEQRLLEETLKSLNARF